MFLKLEYSDLRSVLVIKGAEDLNTLPNALFNLPLPIASVITLLTSMREVVLDGEPMEFKYGNYIVNLSRGAKHLSENTIYIAVEEVKGAMSRPVFNQQFDGYCNGTRSLLKGIHEFKGKVKTISLDEDNEGATVCDVVDYKKLVNECNTKSNNAKKLAQTLYDKWLNLGRDEEHLIGIYKAMSVITLSTYELERLTKKRLIMDVNGYSLIDCSYDDTVTMDSDKAVTDFENDSDIFEAYRTKLGISEDAWDAEFTRLTALCGSDNPKDIAAFIQDALM